jgi:Ca2+-binding RTX toxin-like protein
MEALEDRTHLSITWTNRGDDSDNFDTVFGGAADTARGVVDSAIAEWNRVVTGYKGEAFDVDLTVSMNPGNSGTSAVGGASERTDDGVPVVGSVSINTAGPIGSTNWYLDPTPDDHSEFQGDLIHAFARNPTPGGPADGLRDLRTILVHEIGHVMGIAGGADLIYDNFDVLMWDTNQPDPMTSEPDDEYWIFQGPSVTALMTTYDILAGSSDAAGHNAMARDDNTPFTWAGFEVFSAVDTMQPTSLSVRRVLLSKKTSLMLQDMGYDVTPPETFGTFHATLDASGMLRIRGGNDDTEIDNVNQGPSADNISVSRVGNELVVSVDVGVDVPGTGSGQTVNDQQPAFVSRFNVADVDGIRIYGLGGDDTITLSGNLGVNSDDIFAYGGDGNDVMSASGVTNERVEFRGDDGNDTLTGTPFADDLRGGDGYDNLSGGGGDDDLFGDAGNDILTGGSGNDDLVAGDGNDSVYGGTGNDYLVGGDGNDLLVGQVGSDTCYGNQGRDNIVGGSILSVLRGPYPADGADVLSGYEGDDVIHGDNVYHGTSLSLGAGGNDLIRGGDGNDVMYGNLGDDNIHGDAGNDTADGMAGDDRVYGEEGNDTLRGGAGADLLYGLDGNDNLAGDDGNDRLTGGMGSDVLRGGNNDDQLIGGIAFVGTQDASPDTLGGDGGNDELWGDNYSVGGAPLGGADVLLGDAGDDVAHGGPGNDRVEGGAGTDELHGDEGDDLVRGGDGNDVLRGEGGNDILLGEADRDDLAGDLGRDVLIGGRQVDALAGGDGEDILISGYTDFDNSNRALFAVRAEWASARAYDDRVRNLRGLPGPTFAMRLNGDTFLVAPGANSTVFFDGEPNVLNGQVDDDWFFRSPPDVTDAVGGEAIN